MITATVTVRSIKPGDGLELQWLSSPARLPGSMTPRASGRVRRSAGRRNDADQRGGGRGSRRSGRGRGATPEAPPLPDDAPGRVQRRLAFAAAPRRIALRCDRGHAARRGPAGPTDAGVSFAGSRRCRPSRHLRNPSRRLAVRVLGPELDEGGFHHGRDRQGFVPARRRFTAHPHDNRKGHTMKILAISQHAAADGAHRPVDVRTRSCKDARSGSADDRRTAER